MRIPQPSPHAPAPKPNQNESREAPRCMPRRFASPQPRGGKSACGFATQFNRRPAASSPRQHRQSPSAGEDGASPGGGIGVHVSTAVTRKRACKFRMGGSRWSARFPCSPAWRGSSRAGPATADSRQRERRQRSQGNARHTGANPDEQQRSGAGGGRAAAKLSSSCNRRTSAALALNEPGSNARRRRGVIMWTQRLNCLMDGKVSGVKGFLRKSESDDGGQQPAPKFLLFSISAACACAVPGGRSPPDVSCWRAKAERPSSLQRSGGQSSPLGFPRGRD